MPLSVPVRVLNKRLLSLYLKDGLHDGTNEYMLATEGRPIRKVRIKEVFKAMMDINEPQRENKPRQNKW